MSAAHVLALGGLTLVAAMSPGPDFVMVVRSSILSGRTAGMACATGIALGVFVWAIASALGVAGVLASSALVFSVVKVIGAAYLILLGVRALAVTQRDKNETIVSAGTSGSSVKTALRQGLFTNLLNPKVAVFFIALLPQFVPARPALTDIVLLSGVSAVVAFMWFLLLANVINALRRLFARRAFLRSINAVMGAVLLVFGVRIAIQSY
ncbi:LysE family translocator [Nocardia sp. NPDC006044]|uniref:LysE family translocator n=1 Tax=Nocardia sp. NPDC006044 TaxID=3364306 RepID=UPI0036B5AEF1